MLSVALLAALLLLLIAAAVGDLRTRTIPNALNATVALLAIGWWMAQGYGGSTILVHVGVGAAIFALFAGCFALGWIGGGDVKLIAALALWLPPLLVVRMLTLMVLAGGLLALFSLAWHRLRRSEEQPEVPYGVAIAAAMLIVLSNDLLTMHGA